MKTSFAGGSYITLHHGKGCWLLHIARPPGEGWGWVLGFVGGGHGFDWRIKVYRRLIYSFFFQQVLMVSDKKPEYWISNCTTALKDASRKFSSPSPVNGFYLFESTPYWTKGHADEHETKWETENWLKYKDLIFKDHSSSLEIIPPVTLQGIPVSFLFLMPLFAPPPPPPLLDFYVHFQVSKSLLNYTPIVLH